MKSKVLFIISCLAAITSCATQKSVSAPAKDQNKVAIVCHRGFWKSTEGGMSENSIASLKAAQSHGFWGSECDVHLTADGIVIVNHNADIEGKNIRDHAFADFKSCLLPNGERRPSFDEYLTQTEKCATTMLIIELKRQKANASMTSLQREDALVDKVLELIKNHGLFSPERVAFISFSYHMCKRIAELAPGFTNQFLLDDFENPVTPAQCHADGINGIDYHRKFFRIHPEWIKEAKDLGMSTNVWTVNKPEDMTYMTELGLDAITTNEPLMLRDLLGKKELKTK